MNSQKSGAENSESLDWSEKLVCATIAVSWPTERIYWYTPRPLFAVEWIESLHVAKRHHTNHTDQATEQQRDASKSHANCHRAYYKRW